jgi:hypothetical protein
MPCGLAAQEALVLENITNQDPQRFWFRCGLVLAGWFAFGLLVTRDELQQPHYSPIASWRQASPPTGASLHSHLAVSARLRALTPPGESHLCWEVEDNTTPSGAFVNLAECRSTSKQQVWLAGSLWW